jgi:hypothetical protein
LLIALLAIVTGWGRGDALSAGKQLDVALYRWETGASFRVVGRLFKIGKSTVFKCSCVVAYAIVHVLKEKTIS